MVTRRIVSANIMSNPVMPIRKARADMLTVTGLLGITAGSIGWQEIAPRSYRNTLHFMRPNQETYNVAATPMTASASERVMARGRRRVHRGIARITPARKLVWQVYREDDGTVWWHINTHFISAAWSSSQRRTKRLRQRRWRKHNRMLAALVTELRHLYGPNGVVTGDFNRSKFVSPALTALGAIYHFPNHGSHGRSYYDYLISFGATHASPVTRVPLHSDHDAVWFDVTFPNRG